MQYRFSIIANFKWVQGLLIIFALNGCTIIDGQKTAPPVVTTPAVTDTTTYHTVAPGETLYDIAYRYGYSDPAAIAAWNGIAPPYAVTPGQRLLVSRPTGYAYTPPTATFPVTPSPATKAKPITSPKKPAKPTKAKSPGKTENYHTVRPGENLYRIAKNYGYTTAQVAAWNNIAPPYTLEVGQRLRIVTGKTPPSNTRSTPPIVEESYHTVQVGESLGTIAGQYGYDPKDVAAWNNLQPPYNLTVGQLLRVSPTSSGSTPPIANVPINKADFHTVTSQDSLYSIAKIYGQSVADIAVWNNLQPPYNLQIGQPLRVSANAPSSSATKRIPASTKKGRYRSPTANIQRHVVKVGETLKSIAEKYGLTSFELAIWNGVGSPYTVYPGQNLQIVKP
ncbi:MAG: hypothetical protein BWK79_03595 [Beggiatoa sp. IS2]|nr:MAG: hypothetical protein BWK79_03595 [Beggiatoa sp. IS2]